MSRIINIQSAVTVNPTSYSDNTFGSSYYQNLDNGLASSANTNYARFTMRNTSYHIYYDFPSLSDIPNQATINSVSCTVKGRVSNQSYYPSVQLYANTTAKGSASNITSTSTSNTVSLNTGTWTLSELSNVRLYIKCVTSQTNQSRYFYFYGATLTVNYTVSGTVYEITATSDTSLATVKPSSQELFEGENTTIIIDTNSIGDIVVEDNGVDITDQLVVKQGGGVTIDAVPEDNYTTDFSSNGAAFYNQSNTGTSSIARLLDCIGYSAESPNMTNASSTQRWTYVKDGNNNTSTGWINYKFDFSDIPLYATIISVNVKCYGARESSSTSSQYKATIDLYANDTLKATQEITSTTNSIVTVANPGTWTRDELQDATFRFTVAYYGGWIGGISWTVVYKVSESDYYYEYTLSSISADHNIVVSEEIIIPPEEDETKTYFPITISSINAITTPDKGTTRVESGTSQTITIVPTDPQLTLVLDNGVDVSSQLVAHGGAVPTSALTTVQGASYGFTLNSSTGYYVSDNNGIDKSAALCKVDFDLPVRCLVTIQFINYAEATYDFGVFGNVDVPLTTNYYAAGSGGATITDSSYKLACNTSTYNTSTPQTITYEIEAGEHSIYIKYSKDDATSSNNDTLQFRVTNIEPLETNLYYTYDLNNIDQSHSLIFIFGDVTYYFVTSTTNSEAKLYPNGQMVQLPGDDYRLTIVPENPTDSISITDNGTDVTGNLERKEVETEKEGQTIVAVNYIYRLTNIQASHTLNIVSSTNNSLYLKINGVWTLVRSVYKKTFNDKEGDYVWEKQEISDDLFDSGTIYVGNH